MTDPAWARQILEVDPYMGPVYIMAAMRESDAGRRDEAERLLWKGLEVMPTSIEAYMSAATFHAVGGQEALSRRLQHLCLWIVSFADEIPEDFAEVFKDAVKTGGDPYDPESYELIATVADVQLKESPSPPEVEERLRPFILFNALMRQSERALDHQTMQGILNHAAECVPVLRGALSEWLRDLSMMSHPAACFVIALLGEMDTPAIIEDLLELGEDPDEWRHAQWAMHRIATRMPAETVAVFRKLTPAADVEMLGALAEYMYLMEPTSGIDEALAGLLERIPKLEKDLPAAHLFAAVISTLKKFGYAELAASLETRYEPALTKKQRKYIREEFQGDSDRFMLRLVDDEILGLDIEDVCIERTLMDKDEFDEDEEEFEDEDEFEDGEFDDYVDHEPVVAAPKPGRNDPCWCGSGKKYKKCHLAADEEKGGTRTDTADWEPPEGAARVPPNVIPRLMDCSLRYNNRQEITRAMELYYGDDAPSLDNDDQRGLFTQWLLFGFRNPRTKLTALERFAKEEIRSLNPRERDFVKSLLAARLGLYEAQSVDRGSGVHLKNLYTGELSFVRDVSSSKEMVAWDCIITWLQDFEGDTLFVGNGSLVPRNLLPDFQNWVAENSRAAHLSEEDFIAANSHRLHRAVQEVNEGRLKNLRLVTAEGDDMEFAQAHYEVLDETALLEALRAQIDLVEQEEEDSGGEYHFGWLEGPPKEEGTRTLGHIYIRGSRLRLETQSRPRLKKGRRMLEKIAKRALRHLGESFESPQKAMERMKKERPPSEERPSTEVPSEVQREVLERMKAEHYAKWPDEKLPALKGKTPREAVRTPEGRKAVEDLLRTMENLEAREGRKGNVMYDFGKLRRELGMDR